MLTLKNGGQIETRHFMSNGIRNYRSLYDLMRDTREYDKVRSELNLPRVRIDNNGILYIKTFHLESWSGTVTRNFYFVFDKYNQLVPNFDADEVAVDKTNTIVCIVYDPPFNMDNANVEYCASLGSLYIHEISHDRYNPQYKIRHTAQFVPGQGIPSVYELSNMVKDIVKLSESHEYETINDLRKSRMY